MIEKDLLNGNYVIKFESKGLKTFIVDIDVALRPDVKVECEKSLNYNDVKLCYVKRSEDCKLVILIARNRSEAIGCYMTGYAGPPEGAYNKCLQCANELSVAVDNAIASKAQ